MEELRPELERALAELPERPRKVVARTSVRRRRGRRLAAASLALLGAAGVPTFATASGWKVGSPLSRSSTS